MSPGTQRQSKQLLAEHFQGLEDEEEEEEEEGQPDGEEEGQGGGASEDELRDEKDNGDNDQNGIDQQNQKVCHVMSCHVMSCHVMSCHVIAHFKMYEFVRFIRLWHKHECVDTEQARVFWSHCLYKQCMYHRLLR